MFVVNPREPGMIVTEKIVFDCDHGVPLDRPCGMCENLRWASEPITSAGARPRHEGDPYRLVSGPDEIYPGDYR